MDEDTGFAEARDEEAAPAPDDESEFASVAGGGSRRRILTFSIAGAAAAVGIVAISAVVIAQAGSNPVASPSPSESPTPFASVSASPSPSAEELVAAPELGTGFPAAFVLTDAVLAEAGPGWAVESYASLPNYYEEDPAPPAPGAIYLVDPEGTRYLAYSSSPAQNEFNLTAVSWRESTGEVVLDHGDYANEALVLNLATGEATPIDGADVGIPSDEGTPDIIMAAADGAELWRVWDGTSQRYIRWTDGEGYTVASIDLDSRGDSTFNLVGDVLRNYAIRSDGRVSLFESRDDPDDHTSWEPDTLYTYDVSADQSRSFRFNSGPAVPDTYECSFSKWSGAATASFVCNLSSNDIDVPVVLAGLHGLEEPAVESAITALDGLVGMTSRVEYGKATDPYVLLPPCAC